MQDRLKQPTIEKLNLAEVPALILVGGLGTRLRPAISDLPKPMAPIAGRPFLEYLIRWLRKSGVCRLVLCAGYFANVIRTYFGEGEDFGVEIVYSIETEPLGTWGAIRLAKERVGRRPFLVLNGDSWLQLDLEQFLNFQWSIGALAAIATTRVVEAARFGSLKVDATSRVEEFIEKTKAGSGLINGGVYILSPEIFSLVPSVRGSLEREVFPQLVSKGVFAFPTEGFFVDIGVPEEYKRLNSRPDPWLRALQIPMGGTGC